MSDTVTITLDRDRLRKVIRRVEIHAQAVDGRVRSVLELDAAFLRAALDTPDQPQVPEDHWKEPLTQDRAEEKVTIETACWRLRKLMCTPGGRELVEKELMRPFGYSVSSGLSDEGRETLTPFVEFARNNVDEHGWKEGSCHRDRIVDWFGPSDFRDLAAFLRKLAEHPSSGSVTELKERLEVAAANHQFNYDKAEGIRLAIALIDDPDADPHG